MLDECKKDFLLFVQMGFAAANASEEQTAIACFQAAQALMPKEPIPKIGMGYVHFLKLDLKQATPLFAEVMKEHPKNEVAYMMHALCLTFSKKNGDKGAELLAKGARSADSSIQKLADHGSDLYSRFFKKSPSLMKAAASKPKPKSK